MAGTKRPYAVVDLEGPVDFLGRSNSSTPSQYWSHGSMQNPIDLDSDGGSRVSTPATSPMSVDAEPASFDTCRAYTLQLFPDIAEGFLRELYDATVHLSAGEQQAEIVDRIVRRPKYPRNAQPEKVPPSKTDPRDYWIHFHIGENLLKDEFDRVPVQAIRQKMRQHDNIRDAYLDIAAWKDRPQLRKRRKSGSTVQSDDPQTGLLLQEFKAAKEEWTQMCDKVMAATEAAQAEADNEQEARAAGQMQDCGCCFTETPVNRLSACSGSEQHSFCKRCIRLNAENEIGNGRCRPKCMDMSGCESQFPEHVLRCTLDDSTLQRLLRSQLKEDLKTLQLDGLEECPFCEYIEICPPVDCNREFRCKDSKCGKVTCRLCHAETHIPITCEEADLERQKDSKIEARHAVEEAMTKALVRTCNKCKTPFVKTEGCNKMTCNRCGNKQCYVCASNINGYEHFGTGAGDGKCPPYDDRGVAAQHIDDVKKAEKVATDKIRAERPEIQAEDLVINLSDAVKKAEADEVRLGHRDEWLAQPWLAGEAPAMLDRVRMARFNQVQAQIQAQMEPLHGPLRLPERRPPPAPVPRPMQLPEQGLGPGPHLHAYPDFEPQPIPRYAQPLVDPIPYEARHVPNNPPHDWLAQVHQPAQRAHQLAQLARMQAQRIRLQAQQAYQQAQHAREQARQAHQQAQHAREQARQAHQRAQQAREQVHVHHQANQGPAEPVPRMFANQEMDGPWAGILDLPAALPVATPDVKYMPDQGFAFDFQGPQGPQGTLQSQTENLQAVQFQNPAGHQPQGVWNLDQFNVVAGQHQGPRWL